MFKVGRCVMTQWQGGRVTVEDGVVVGTGGGRALRADVFVPPAGTSNGAGVLLIHGGGWAQGDRTQLRGYGILLGRIGYTCVACEYRLAGEAKWPAQIHDVKTALRWMRANSDRLSIDPAKIAVSGNSAGGHLSLMMAGTQNVAEYEGEGGHARTGTEVAAAISFYGPALLGRPGAALADMVRFLLGKDATDAQVAAASPVTHVSAAHPPALLITGNRDELVPDESSFAMYRAITQAGGRAELHVYEGAPHGFDAISEFGRQCAAIMALFLDRHVVRPRAVALPQAAAAG
jgi:acetyl esterase/lipase